MPNELYKASYVSGKYRTEWRRGLYERAELAFYTSIGREGWVGYLAVIWQRK